MNSKPLSAAEFDARFDAGEDMGDFVDWSAARRLGLEVRRVNIDFPQWMVDRLDREAKRRGVTRQSLIKMWIADELDARAAKAKQAEAPPALPPLDQAA